MLGCDVSPSKFSFLPGCRFPSDPATPPAASLRQHEDGQEWGRERTKSASKVDARFTNLGVERHSCRILVRARLLHRRISLVACSEALEAQSFGTPGSLRRCRAGHDRRWSGRASPARCSAKAEGHGGAR